MKSTSIQHKLAQKLKQTRLEKGISQEVLAHKAGITRTYVGSIEREEKLPSIITLERIAVALGVSLSDLFNFEKVKTD